MKKWPELHIQLQVFFLFGEIVLIARWNKCLEIVKFQHTNKTANSITQRKLLELQLKNIQEWDSMKISVQYRANKLAKFKSIY